MRRSTKLKRELSIEDQVMALVPVGGWIAGGPSGLTISDGKRYITAPTYESLLILILQSPFSPSPSTPTIPPQSTSDSDSRDESQA